MRVLFLLSQLPEDPGSRVPWAHLRIARTLALAGHEVRVLGTSALAHPLRVPAFRLLQDAGLSPRILPAKSQGRLRPEIHYSHEVDCRLVDVGMCRPADWEAEHAQAYDVALDSELREFVPEIVVTGAPRSGEIRRFERIKARGHRMVLCLANANAGAMDAKALLSLYSGILCQSHWIARQYPELNATVLRPPIPAQDIKPDTREPVCVLFPFPTRENGLYFLVRLAEQLSLADSDCPILVMTAAGAEAAGRNFLAAGRSAGFDLSQYSNIMLADPTAQPQEIWASAQVFVVPGLGNPPVSIISEALVNGIPTILSDRFADEEMLRNCLTLPLPLDYGPETKVPLPASAVEPWTELILRLTSDAEFYEAEARRAREEAASFDPAVLAPHYDAFFRDVAEGAPAGER